MAQLNDLLVMGQSTLLGPITIGNSLIPNNNNTYTLGNSSFKFSSVYASQFRGALASLGNVTAETGTTYPAHYGLTMQQTYQNGYPIDYGNVLTMRGAGASQLLIGWSSASQANQVGADAPAFIRSKRDTNDAQWSQWRQIITSAGGPVDGQLKTSRTGARWIDARDNALIVYDTSIRSSSYSPLYSLKTVSGEVSSGLIYSGDENGVPVEPDLVWVHNTDSNYPNNNSTQTEMLRVSIGGAITAKSYNATSDMRLKTNIQPLLLKGSILDLPLYKFDFIDGPKNQIGCMAQDLQDICPEIVDENSNGYLTIQESKIVYLLIDEIKKLKDEIQKLKEI